jgi:hypothetical protein
VLFKLVVVGSDGPVKKGVLDELAYDMFEGDYLATIGTDIHMCTREIDGETFKLVMWAIADDIKFQQLHRAYYQNASMILLTVESTDSEALQHYRELLNEIHKVQGKVPLTIVSAVRDDIDEKEIRSLADEVEASQVVLDFDDKETLTRFIDRMVREVRFVMRDTLPYPIIFLRTHGLALESFDIDTAIHVIRNSDSPFKDPGMFNIERIDEYLKNSGSSIFFDIDQLARTQLVTYIPRILNERRDELERVWAIKKGNRYDLRWIWLTAYGFEILRALGVGLIVNKEQFQLVQHKFSLLDFEIPVRGPRTKPPNLQVEDNLRAFVWHLVERMTSNH